MYCQGKQPSLPGQAAVLAIGIFQPPSLILVHLCQDPVPSAHRTDVLETDDGVGVSVFQYGPESDGGISDARKQNL